MNKKKHIRCPKCKSILQVTVRAEALIVTCPKCHCSLRIPPEKSTGAGTEFPVNKSREDLDPLDEQHFETAHELSFEGTMFPSAEVSEGNSQLPPRIGSKRRSLSASEKPEPSFTTWQTFCRLPAFVRVGTVAGGISAIILLLLVSVRYLDSTPPTLEEVTSTKGTTGTVTGRDLTPSDFVPVADGANVRQQKAATYRTLKTRSLLLKTDYSLLFFNDSRNELVGVDEGRNEVHLYSNESLKEAEPEPIIYSVPSGCRHVVFKPIGEDGFYCAAGSGNAVSVFSADGRGAMQTIQMPIANVFALACSENPGDPWVFVGYSAQSGDFRLSAVNVTTRDTVQYVAELLEPNLCVSPSGHKVTDGVRVLSRSDVLQPPSGIPHSLLYLVDAQSKPLHPLLVAHGGQYLVRRIPFGGPQSRLEFFDFESHAQVRTDHDTTYRSDLQPCCAFRKSPIIIAKWDDGHAQSISMDDPECVVVEAFSTSSFEYDPDLYRIRFSLSELQQLRDRKNSQRNFENAAPVVAPLRAIDYSHDLKVVADNRNDQLLSVLGRELVIAPVSEFRHGNRMVNPVPTVSAGPHPPGRRIQIPLAVNSDAQVTLKEPLPSGSSVNGSTFEWTPADDQLGDHQLRFEYDAEGVKKTMLASVRVGHRWSALKDRYRRFCFGTHSGGLFAWSTDGRVIDRYEPARKDSLSSAPMTGSIAIAGKMLDLVEKGYAGRSYLCLLMRDPHAVQVYDAQTMEVVKNIPLEDSSTQIQHLFASENSGDPFVYYSDGERETGVVRIDTLTNAGELPNVEGIVLVAPDGRTIFDSSRPYVFSKAFETSLPNFTEWAFGRALPMQYRGAIMDRGADLVLSGSEVRPALRPDKVPSLKNRGVYVQDDSVVTALLKREELIIQRKSYTNHDDSGHSIRIALQWPVNVPESSTTKIEILYLHGDAARQELIVCHFDQLMVIPFSALGFAAEPAMDAEVVPNELLLAGSTTELTLKPAAPTDSITIDSMPEGMTADGMKLTWQPTRSDIGMAPLQITVHRGKRLVQRTICLRVCESIDEYQQFQGLAGNADLPVQKELQVAGQEPALEPAKTPGDSPSIHLSPLPSHEWTKDELPGKVLHVVCNEDADTTLLVCENAPQLRLFRNREIQTRKIVHGSLERTISQRCKGVVSRRFQSKPAFVILAEAPGFAPEVIVLDAATLEEIKRLPLLTRGAMDLCTSAIESDPWVFGCFGKSDVSRPDASLVAINLETGGSRELLTDVSRCRISADGRLLYLYGQQRSLNTCIALRTTEFDASSIECRELPTPEITPQPDPYSVSPFGATVLLGNSLFDDHLKGFLAELPKNLMSPIFLTERSAIVGLLPKVKSGSRDRKTGAISLVSFDTNRLKLSDLEVVVNEYKQVDQERNLMDLAKSWKLLPLEKQDRLVCVTDDEFIVFQLEDLLISNTAHLGARILGPLAFKTGHPGEMQLDFPKSITPLKIVESQLLPGMVLAGNRIQWTPDITALGQSEISLTFTSGTQTRQCRVMVNVVRPSASPKADFRHAALSTVDGSVVATSNDRQQILRYPIVDAVVATNPNKSLGVKHTVNGLVTRTLAGRHLVIAGSHVGQELMVIDAESWEVTGSIPVNDWDGVDLCVSKNSEDPFVYFTNGKDICAASLKTMRPLGIVVSDADLGFAVDPSGSVAYIGRSIDNASAGVASGLLATGFETDLPEFIFSLRPHQKIPRVPETKIRFIPNTQSTSVFIDRILFDAELEARIRLPSKTHSAIPVGVTRRGDAVISIQYGDSSVPVSTTERMGSVELVASSSSDEARIYGQITLADRELISEIHKTAPVNWRALIDDQNERVVCFGRDKIWVIPFDELNVPGSQPLSAVLAGPHYATIGRSERWTIFGAPSDARADFSKLPAGAVADGSSVIWTPSEQQAGPHFIEVQLQRQGETVTLTHEVEASWPAINLPFSPAGLSADDEGVRVAAWQRSAIREDFSDNNCGQLLVVDTSNRKTLFSGPILDRNPIGRIRNGIIAHEKFLLSNITDVSSELWAIPLDGSSPAEQVPIPGNRARGVFSLSMLGSDVLVELEDRVAFLDAQTLRSARVVKMGEQSIRRPAVMESGFGPSVFGVVIDDLMNPVIAVSTPWPASDLFAPSAIDSTTSASSDETPPNPTTVSARMRNQPVKVRVVVTSDVEQKTSVATSKLMSTVPLRARKTPGYFERQVVAEVHYSDASGALLRRPIGRVNFPSKDEFRGFSYLIRKSDVVLCAGRKLFILPLPDLEAFAEGIAQNSTAIVPVKPQLIVSGTTDTILPHQMVGEISGITASMNGTVIEGISLNPETLEVTISGPVLRHALTSLRAEACIENSSESREPPESLAQLVVDTLVDIQREPAKELLKYEGSEILESVPVSIMLKDQNQVVIHQLSYVIFIAISPGELQTMIVSGLRDPRPETENTQNLLNSAQKKLQQIIDAQSGNEDKK